MCVWGGFCFGNNQASNEQCENSIIHAAQKRRAPCLPTMCINTSLAFLKTRAAPELGHVPGDTHRSHHRAQRRFLIPATCESQRAGAVPLGQAEKPAAGDQRLSHPWFSDFHTCSIVSVSVCLSVCLGLFGERRQKAGSVYTGMCLCQ